MCLNSAKRGVLTILCIIGSLLWIVPFIQAEPPLDDEIAQLETNYRNFYVKYKGGISKIGITSKYGMDFAAYEVYHKQVRNAADKKELFEALDSVEKWIIHQQQNLPALKKQRENLESRFIALADKLAQSQKIDLSEFTSPPESDQISMDWAKPEPAKIPQGDLNYQLFLLIKALNRSRGRSSPEVQILCQEIQACLTRFAALDECLILECQWMVRDTEILRDCLQSVETVKFRGTDPWPGFVDFLPAGFDLYRRYLDLFEIQNQIIDLLLATPTEAGLWGKALDYPGLFMADISLRSYLLQLYKHPKFDKKIVDILDSCWSDIYHGPYLNHIFMKYKTDNCDIDKIVTVLNRWQTYFHPETHDITHTKLALLEVLNYQQGTVYGATEGKTRFHPKIWSLSADPDGGIEKMGRDDVKWPSEEDSHAIFGAKRKIDCYIAAAEQGIILANRGCSGIYPRLEFGGSDSATKIDFLGHHAEISWVNPGKLLPAGLYQDEMCAGRVFFVRTIASWVWAEMCVPDDKVLQQEIPYYYLKRK
jgi:hypothetical protein